MTREESVKLMTDKVAKFVAHIAKKLPDDVVAKLEELGAQENNALPKVLYETMTKNQNLAVALDRPSCQDTGVLQFWVKCGTKFPLIDDLEALLKEAVVQATFATPLRHTSVETFDEYNTKRNVTYACRNLSRKFVGTRRNLSNKKTRKILRKSLLFQKSML